MKLCRVALLATCTALVGCGSPEAARTRGGHGGDVGNRATVVKMHEGSDPYWKTPRQIAAESPALEPARQAERRSRQ